MNHPLSLALLFVLAFFPRRLPSFPLEGPDTRVAVGVGQSTSLRVPGVSRVTVANTKVAKVRAFPPAVLVVTGVRPGTTTVRAWTGKDVESVFHVEVLPADLFGTASGLDEPEVIKIALEFLELDQSFNQSLGIRWPDVFQFSGQAALSGAGGSTGINYSAGITSARGLLQHLVRDGWAKWLAQPELYVRLGEEAVFHSGGEIPVSTSSEQYGRNQKHVEWKPFGLTVRVRPRSGDRLHISSDINVEISELNTAQALEGIPAINRRQVTTKMNSRDGETVILSGLVRQTAHSGHEGIPGLSSIPLIGSLLFSSHTQGSQEGEILMAVTFSLSTRNDHRRGQELKRRFEGAVAP